MSELEKEYLEDLDHYDEGMGIHSTSYKKCKERLIRLAQIESAKPSEALKCVDVLKEDGCITTLVQGKALETIRQALLKAEKLEKAWGVVKKKCSSGNSNLWLVSCLPNYEHYMAFIKDTTNHDHDLVRNEHNELTQQEFELLKEVLE